MQFVDNSLKSGVYKTQLADNLLELGAVKKWCGQIVAGGQNGTQQCPYIM